MHTAVVRSDYNSFLSSVEVVDVCVEAEGVYVLFVAARDRIVLDSRRKSARRIRRSMKSVLDIKDGFVAVYYNSSTSLLHTLAALCVPYSTCSYHCLFYDGPMWS